MSFDNTSWCVSAVFFLSFFFLIKNQKSRIKNQRIKKKLKNQKSKNQKSKIKNQKSKINLRYSISAFSWSSCFLSWAFFYSNFFVSILPYTLKWLQKQTKKKRYFSACLGKQNYPVDRLDGAICLVTRGDGHLCGETISL